MAKKKKKRNGNYRNGRPEKHIVSYRPGKMVLYDMQQLERRYDDEESRQEFRVLAGLCRKYPGLSIDDIISKEHAMFVAYNQELVDRGIAVSTEELNGKDMLDMSALDYKAETLPFSELALSSVPEELRFYQCLPCFESGLMKDDRLHYALYFEIRELNPDEKTAVIYVGTYGVYEPDADKYLLGTNATYRLHPDGTIEPVELNNGSDVFREVSIEETAWSRLDRDVWTKHVLVKEKALERKTSEKPLHEKEIPLSVMSEFHKCIRAVNYILSKKREKAGQQKPANAENPEGRAHRPQGTNAHDSDGPAPKRVVRHFGKLVVVSKSKPVRASRSGMRRYKVASWTVRGHTRTLKSGKVVYVKPTTAKRKALEKDVHGPDGKPLPATLALHGPEGEEPP